MYLSPISNALFVAEGDYYRNSQLVNAENNAVPTEPSATQPLYMRLREVEIFYGAEGLEHLLWIGSPACGRGVTTVKSKQYGCLNQTNTVTTPADRPAWIG